MLIIVYIICMEWNDYAVFHALRVSQVFLLHHPILMERILQACTMLLIIKYFNHTPDNSVIDCLCQKYTP